MPVWPLGRFACQLPFSSPECSHAANPRLEAGAENRDLLEMASRGQELSPRPWGTLSRAPCHRHHLRANVSVLSSLLQSPKPAETKIRL